MLRQLAAFDCVCCSCAVGIRVNAKNRRENRSGCGRANGRRQSASCSRLGPCQPESQGCHRAGRCGRERRFQAIAIGEGNMARSGSRLLLATAAIGALVTAAVSAEAASKKTIERGKYLVGLGGCFDCHTPGYFFGKPDMAHYLGGSDVGFEMPGLGVFVGPNLTPDADTGLGEWSEAQIVRALQTGKRPDGRELAPIMPWRAFANLTKSDAHAIAAYLKSLPAVSHRVPGPFGPDEKASVFRMKVVPPEAAAAK